MKALFIIWFLILAFYGFIGLRFYLMEKRKASRGHYWLHYTQKHHHEREDY